MIYQTRTGGGNVWLLFQGQFSREKREGKRTGKHHYSRAATLTDVEVEAKYKILNRIFQHWFLFTNSHVNNNPVFEQMPWTLQVSGTGPLVLSLDLTLK